MHTFSGRWITTEEFSALSPRNVFHRQLDRVSLPCTEHLNRHILFRKHFFLEKKPHQALLYLSADDYYHCFVNGAFVSQGPAPSYHFRQNYNVLDITGFLKEGKNLLALHTLYQGLINRVWQSGDHRHGLILDLVADGETIVLSDESFLTCLHSGYSILGVTGYETQFLEKYDSAAYEVGFERPDFDDSAWQHAVLKKNDDHVLMEQQSHMLVFENIPPVSQTRLGNSIVFDFGSNYVGTLSLRARGKRGDEVRILCGQELLEDGSVRFKLRANCEYDELWALSDGESELCWYDYKSFRYAQVFLPEGADLLDVSFKARHYPFSLKARLAPPYQDDPRYAAIWNLCVHTLEYGVQEVIQDCMEREKGFYVGDGCYTALAHFILTRDDSIIRKLIDDALASAFITPGLVTCLDCSMMQEIAEYPLILISLALWHYRLCGDRDYLAACIQGFQNILESYRQDYEKDGLLQDLDKWCVVEWPKNYQDGYAVDIAEGKVCHEPHVSINAYYIEAIETLNKIRAVCGLPPYRDTAPLKEAFFRAFYDEEKHLFSDGRDSRHISLIGNVFPYAFRLIPDELCRQNMLSMLRQRGVHSFSFFGAFVFFEGLVRDGQTSLLQEMLLDEGAWLRILREGGTTTFEGWGRDVKWNTSLFHLTMAFAAIFLSDIDLSMLFS